MNVGQTGGDCSDEKPETVKRDAIVRVVQLNLIEVNKSEILPRQSLKGKITKTNKTKPDIGEFIGTMTDTTQTPKI